MKLATDDNGLNRFNPNMFALARKLRQKTQSEIHVETGISQAQLSKIEQGLQIPTDDHLEMFSSVLSFPREFFLQSESYFPPLTPFHRKRASLSKKILEHAEAIANLKRIHLMKLLPAVEVDGFIPKLDLIEYGDVSGVAQAIRSHFHLPHGPIDNVVALLEAHGVFVFLENFPSIQLAGFTLIGNGSHPLMFINKNAPGDMERLTIGHELGHLVMHDVISETAEEEAWAFAAEFLMPKEDILTDLRKARTLQDYSALKRKWKISMMALMRRSHDLHVIDDNQYRYLMQKMAPYRINEPVQVPQEKSTLFEELITTYTDELEYSKADLCAVLNVHETLFDDLYGNNEKRIRLIK